MSNIIIGSAVIIINDGMLYPGYERWAKAHHLNNFKKDQEPRKNEKTFNVVAIGPHITSPKLTLCGIEHPITGNQYIVQIEGLESLNIGTYISKVSVKKNLTNMDNYPNKCPQCNYPSYNSIFIGTVECTNIKCINHKG